MDLCLILLLGSYEVEIYYLDTIVHGFLVPRKSSTKLDQLGMKPQIPRPRRIRKLRICSYGQILTVNLFIYCKNSVIYRTGPRCHKDILSG